MPKQTQLSENVELTEREEIESLLPWFTTDRLDPQDHARVQAYIDAHPDMQSQLTLVLDERHATVLENEAINRSGFGGLEQLRQSIEAERSVVDRASSWLSQFAQLFTKPTPSAVRWAGAAAAVVLVAQVAAIGTLMTDRSGHSQSSYTTATGQTAGADAGTRVLVQFTDTASASKIAAFLQAVEAEITAGPKPGGLFEVRLSKAKLSDAEAKAKTEVLVQNKDLIKLVVPQGS